MTLVRVYCGLASADSSAPAPDAQAWLTVAVVDDSGRLLDICEVSDDPGGYAELCALFAQRAGDPWGIAVATDSNEYVVTQLLNAAGRYLAYTEDRSADDYAERFADDDSPEEIRSGPAERRAIGLARALQAGVLSAVPQPAPVELTSLKPLLSAHAAIVSGRQQSAGTLREVLRELYPAALRAYADPAEPVPLAVLEALPEPGQLSGATAGRSRENQVIGKLVDTGIADKNTLADAVTALRVAVAETPRRNGVTRAMTSAVAETVRQTVAAVRSCDAAAESLVGVIADRLAIPATSAARPASAPATQLGRGEPAAAPAPLRVVSDDARPVSGGRRPRADAPPTAPAEPAAAAAAALSPNGGAVRDTAAARSTTYLEKLAMPAPAASSTGPNPISTGAPSPRAGVPTAIPPSTRQGRAAARAAAASTELTPDPATQQGNGFAASSSPYAPATAYSAAPPEQPEPVSTPPASLPPVSAPPAGRRAAPDEPLPSRQSHLPAAFATGFASGAYYHVPADRTAEGDRQAPLADESPAATTASMPPVPRLSPEVPAPGSRSSWPLVGDRDSATEERTTGAFGGGSRTGELTPVGADRSPDRAAADRAAAIRAAAERAVADRANASDRAFTDRPAVADRGAGRDRGAGDWAVNDRTFGDAVRAESEVAAAPTGAADVPRIVELPRQREGRVTPPWQADDLPPEPPTLRLVEPAPMADPALSSPRPNADDLDTDLRVDPPALRLVESDSDLPSRGSRVADRAPDAPPETDSDDSDLLIFSACRSAWFTDDAEDEDELEWATEADQGWQAAEQAARPAVGAETTAGLPRRVPQQNLVPGSPVQQPAERPLRIVRDAASIAAHTSGYFRGYRRGQEVGGYSVGGRPGRESAGGWDFSRESTGGREYSTTGDFEYRSAR